MSVIVDYRNRVVEAIRETLGDDLYHVDWYDGLFDVEDLEVWGGSAPAAYVANLNVPTRQHATGQMLGDVEMVVVVVTTDDRAPEARASDAQNWDIMERIADLVNENSFGLRQASIPDGLSIKKLRHPELRRNGVSLGVVEWTVNITIGRNRALDRDEPKNDAGETYPMPRPISARLRAENEPIIPESDEP